MRVGQNPLKAATEVHQPERIAVSVLTYAPFLSGYWGEMLDVIRECLSSLRASTDVPHDLMVLDNGSCREVVEFLTNERQEGRIQLLILSNRNLGKGGAWNILFQAAPGEIVAYTDCDARFSPGWLDRSLEILETYPRAGMVTSRPFRTPPEFFTRTLEWAGQNSDVKMERGEFIPWRVFREFDLSLAQEESEVRKRYDSTHDIRLTYHGVSALVGASHYQFVARRSVLQEFLPFAMDRPMGQVRQLDQRMNEAGYLRLMTVEPLMMNMSNSLRSVPASGAAADRIKPSVRRRILDWSPIRRSLLALYHAIFRNYYAD